jgi:apolipoprotein N-acyltransferase
MKGIRAWLVDDRKRLLERCINRFIIYSVVSFVSLITLFHLAILALPFLAYMWTQFFFDVFHLITLIDVRRKRRRQVGALGFYYTYFILAYLLWKVFQEDGSSAKANAFMIANLVSIAPALVFSFMILRKLFGEYWPQIRQKYFNKSSGSEFDTRGKE